MLEPQSIVSISPWLAMAALATATAAAVYFAWRPADTPAEKERRLKVNASGRFADGTVVDFRSMASAEGSGPEELVFYHYSVGGVEYSAAQDIATLRDRIGGWPSRIVGAVNVKYQSQRPSNSIIICEEWSGLRNNGLEGRGSGGRNGSR